MVVEVQSRSADLLLVLNFVWYFIGTVDGDVSRKCLINDRQSIAAARAFMLRRGHVLREARERVAADSPPRYAKVRWSAFTRNQKTD